MPHFFNPNQARVPAGRHGGGQWTREGGGPDAIVRPAFWQRPAVQVGSRVAQRANEALLALFAALSARNSPEQRAVIKFRAREFLAEAGKLKMDAVTVLDRKEVGEICKELDTVQGLSDDGFTKFWPQRRALGASNFGTQVHKYVEKKIKAERGKYPTLETEVSFLKTMDEAPPAIKQEMEDSLKKATVFPPPLTYGAKDSIRVDVYEKVGDKTICVYDLKTGKRGLSFPRMVEIAAHVAIKYGAASQIVVTEIRPKLKPSE